MSTEGNERIQFVWIGAFLAGEARQMKSSFVLFARPRPSRGFTPVQTYRSD